jgi:predicted dehydrogenase
VNLWEARDIRKNASEAYTIGIIGAGWISTAYHLPILHNTEGVHVSYVADIDYDQARNASRGYDAEPIEISDSLKRLPDCDVVVLAIPLGAREQYVAEFADRGTAIFSEKPFAVDEQMHRQFLDTAELIGCNYMRTHYNATVQLRRALEAGLFGVPDRIELIEEGKTGATGFGKTHFQTSSEQSGGGILLERGCHSLSQVLTLFPEYDISVTDADITYYKQLDAEVSARLEMSNGDTLVEVEYLISRLRPIGSTLRVDCGSNALVTDPFDPSDQLRIEPLSGAGPTLTFDIEKTAATTTHQAMWLRWREFLSALGNDNLDSETETMPEVTRLIDDIYEEAQ